MITKDSRDNTVALDARRAGGIAIDAAPRRVLRNTYALLSLNLGFSALVAGVSASMGFSHPGILLTLGGYFLLLFLVEKFKNQPAGVVLTFALTGFMGYTLGPIINHYLAMAGGPQMVALALGGTASAFAGLSAYALVTKRDLSGMAPYLFAGILVAFVLALGAYFFTVPALSLAVSGMFVLLMSGLIAWQTQQIVAGGETNYVSATITLFVAIYNMFTSLLAIFGFTSQD